ncbi:MAG TPA: Holliday junction branch migration DNA helicase RuvB, partial [Myxococcaceae bacterium]|nr:Holliday junction branch migration DNA helicase RuvB [Myxococcaceae bacterium]
MSRKVDALSEEAASDDLRVEASLRPRTFSEYVGQTDVVSKLRVYVRAAQKRKEALDL